MENNDSINDERTYKDKINYPLVLLQDISELNKALRYGMNGKKEFINLLSDLTPDILVGIQDKITKIIQECDAAMEKEIYVPLPNWYSNNHIVLDIQARQNEHLYTAIQAVKHIIWARMDELGMLMDRGQYLEKGGSNEQKF